VFLCAPKCYNILYPSLKVKSGIKHILPAFLFQTCQQHWQNLNNKSTISELENQQIKSQQCWKCFYYGTHIPVFVTQKCVNEFGEGGFTAYHLAIHNWEENAWSRHLYRKTGTSEHLLTHTWGDSFGIFIHIRVRLSPYIINYISSRCRPLPNK
jgi:hypothetical protein